jgi:hypothetical protein
MDEHYEEQIPRTDAKTSSMESRKALNAERAFNLCRQPKLESQITKMFQEISSRVPERKASFNGTVTVKSRVLGSPA